MRTWFHDKKQAGEKSGTAPYEEVGEKRTTGVGYLLLILMVIFIVTIGQKVFEDLSTIPKKSEKISACTTRFRDAVSDESDLLRYRKLEADMSSVSWEMEDGEDSSSAKNCVASSYEVEAGIVKHFPRMAELVTEYKRSTDAIEDLDEELNASKKRFDRTTKEYDIRLQEKQAGLPPSVQKNEDSTANDFLNATTDFSALQASREVEEGKREAALASLRALIPDFSSRYESMLSLRKVDHAWYSVKVFVLSLFFVLPFFLMSLSFYLKNKRKNSPYAVIAGAVFIASAILFLEIVFRFLAEIIPYRLIEIFFDFFRQFAFLRYVLYYGSVFLVILLFGGIVYYIQKKVFDPSVIAVRRLKDRKCPGCSFSIHRTMRFCPKCSHVLREVCGSCGKDRFKDLPVCEHCGARK
ncbi:MAG: zinc ribbon domain-containing protein [Candidatus Moraniibacteriota bacterium]|nr:MAG: zinc ribbon domain-containing protein [Candidatus Moranbacteria bacterium]